MLERPLSRRTVLLGGLVSLAPLVHACRPQAPAPVSAAQGQLEAIERSVGGLLGVAAFDTGRGTRIAYRAHERFPLCSTFKLLLAAAVLTRVDHGHEQLDRFLSYNESDLLEHAPVTREHVAEGRLSVRDLCAAAVETSDNTAANLLLSTLGGPVGFTQFLRTQGDEVTRLDRTEPALNSAQPGDLRDTTTPLAMSSTMNTLLLGNALSPSSRQQLLAWLVGCKTGAAKLRAGLPADWKAGDKTGMGERGASNDVAIVWPPQRAPILIAAYSVGSTASVDERNAALAKVARVVAAEFA